MANTNDFTQIISTYWWNMGSKKNDFNGSTSDFFKEKNIKVSSVKHPTQKEITGFRFKFALGNSIFKIDSFTYAQDAAIFIIKLWLTYLGDKAQIKTGGRTININH